MTGMELAVGVCAGLSLSAACGFRVFTPLLIISIAVHFFGFSVGQGFQWIGSWLALITLGTATLVEIVAYYCPWVDSALDLINAPLALIAGSIVMCGMMPDMHPCLKWCIATILGGGLAGVSHAATCVARGVTAVATGGTANNVVASSENAAAATFSVMGILIPIIAVLVVLIVVSVLVFVMLRVFRWSRER